MLGMAVAFFGLLASLMVTLALATRLDALWQLLRRAAGHEQREGVLGAPVRVHGDRRAGALHRVVRAARGSRALDRAALMRRFRDYYRQFEAMTPEEVVGRAARAARGEKRRALSTVPALDLSGTAWPEPPHAEAVNTATFALRRALHAYPAADGGAARAAVAARHGSRPSASCSATARASCCARRARRCCAAAARPSSPGRAGIRCPPWWRPRAAARCPSRWPPAADPTRPAGRRSRGAASARRVVVRTERPDGRGHSRPARSPSCARGCRSA